MSWWNRLSGDNNLWFSCFGSLQMKSFFQLKSLRHIRSALTDDMAVWIAVALIQPRLNYANFVCYGTSARNLDKLQHIQNVADHIVTYRQPKRPLSSHLFNLQCLPIEYWINFKTATLNHKTSATGQPGYLLNKHNTISLTARSQHL